MIYRTEKGHKAVLKTSVIHRATLSLNCCFQIIQTLLALIYVDLFSIPIMENHRTLKPSMAATFGIPDISFVDSRVGSAVPRPDFRLLALGVPELHRYECSIRGESNITSSISLIEPVMQKLY